MAAGMPAPLTHSAPVLIDPVSRDQLQPSRVNEEFHIYVCCCIANGSVLASIQTIEGGYSSGQKVALRCEIDNLSDSNIRSVKVRLRRILVLRASRTPLVKYDWLHRGKYEGLKSKQSRAGDIAHIISFDLGPLAQPALKTK